MSVSSDWIKMRSSLQTHPKVVRILSATNADKFRVVGGLHAVWSVFDAHSVDGKLHGYTPVALDHVIGWPGFADAMIAVRWLLWDGEETLSLPEFGEHNGKSAKRRAEDTKRKREGRVADKPPQRVRNLSADGADEKRTREREREELVRESPASTTHPAARDADAAGAQTPAGAQPEETPPGVNPEAWRLYRGHLCAKRAWSLPRQQLAFGQIRSLQVQGTDVDAVLIWATTRNLADLLDAARRMAGDAQREQSDAERRQPGEGCADAALRVIRTNGLHREPPDDGCLIPLEA